MKKDLKNIKERVILGISLLCILTACIDPYEPKTEMFESVLIVDATITDELKTQKITISETYRLEERRDTVNFVNNARVSVNASSGETFNFLAAGNGEYRSETPFQAIMGESYRLEVTADNEIYESTLEQISGSSQLDSLYVESNTGYNGLPGAAILVNNKSDTRSYYRYTYEETYKIVSPYVRDKDLAVIYYDEGYDFELVPTTKEEEICYNTLESREIVVANTEGVANNNYSGLLIKFLNFRDSKIFHRYSILVKQLNISSEAFNYFETSNELAGNDNVFSQKQPGFLQGNLSSVENENRKIVGYFSVASVDSKRIFFNYTDVLDIDQRPSLIRNCEKFRPISDSLKTFIENDEIKYLENYNSIPADNYGAGPYLVVFTRCRDCTVYGTNVKPEFWID